MEHGGVVGFVVFKDVDGPCMEVLRDDKETIVLFTDYDAAQYESDWLDVVAPVTQKRLEELSRPKVQGVGGSRLSAPVGGKLSQ